MVKINLNNKKAVAINTLFFILMGIMFVGIIYFGLDKMFMIQDELSEQEMQLLKNDIGDAMTFCDNPLNRGSVRIVDVSSNKFNVICFLGTEYGPGDEIYDTDLYTIFQGGDNVVIIEGLVNGGVFDMSQNFMILNSFRVDLQALPEESGCYVGEDQRNFQISLQCN